MNGFRDLIVGTTSERIKRFIVRVAVSLCFAGYVTSASAQAPPFQVNPVITPTTLTTPAIVGTASVAPQQSIAGDTSGLAQAAGIAPGPLAPPLYPPVVGALPSGAGALSAGPFLLTPTLGVTSLYDSNIYSSVTNPQSGPGFNIVPSLLADYNTGIFDTQLYANINSTIYPTLNSANDTFNWQTGAVEKYSPLRDLVFTVQGNYTHSTYAYVTTSALPTPILSPGSPGLLGAAGVVAIQQFAVNPNDTSSIVASVYKEFNRAFISFGGTDSSTQYENASAASPNYEQKSYYGNGALWLTPLLYAYANGIDAFTNPATGPDSSSYMVRGGIGTAPIGLFTGSIYYGWQASAVVDGGTAGGDIYGGLISYAPTAVWNMALSVDELTNISNLTLAPTQGVGLGGLPLVGAAVPLTESVQVTSVALRSNYIFSPETSFFGVLSTSRIAFIDSARVDNAWFATVGVQHRLSNNVMLNANFQYTNYASPEPLTSFTRFLVSVGAVYSF